MPKDHTGRDILLRFVDAATQHPGLIGPEAVAAFLATRVSMPGIHAIMHELLNRLPSLTVPLISELQKQESLTLNKDAVRDFYYSEMVALPRGQSEFWAYIFRELDLLPELHDLATKTKEPVVVGRLAEAMLSLPQQPGSYFHETTASLLKQFEVAKDHPAAMMAMTKAYFKDGNETFALEFFNKSRDASKAQRAAEDA